MWRELKRCLCPETQLDCPFVNDANVYQGACDFAFVAGKTYKVNYEGTEYQLMAELPEVIPFAVIGNSLAFGGADNGVPFVMAVEGDVFIAMFMQANPDGITVTVSISEISEVVHKLDPKYLPESIARTADVETAQTTADEAKTAAETAQIPIITVTSNGSDSTSVYGVATSSDIAEYKDGMLICAIFNDTMSGGSIKININNLGYVLLGVRTHNYTGVYYEPCKFVSANAPMLLQYSATANRFIDIGGYYLNFQNEIRVDVCATSAATAEKVIATWAYERYKNPSLAVIKFINDNTAENPTLKIGSGACAIVDTKDNAIAADALTAGIHLFAFNNGKYIMLI